MTITPFEPNRSVARLTLGELEDFIKQTINQYDSSKISLLETDQSFDETVTPFWQIVTENADQIPDELWDTIPEDASEKLDDYCQFNEDFLSLPTSEDLESLNQDLPRVSLPSLQEIAKLPIAERHKLLSPFMEDMAEDFNRDPELTIFSVLDGEGMEF